MKRLPHFLLLKFWLLSERCYALTIKRYAMRRVTFAAKSTAKILINYEAISFAMTSLVSSGVGTSPPHLPYQ
jgi:hypothetical protein